MKIYGTYELVDQEDINKILKNTKNNNAINLEVLENAATESFKMVNSCIINNNTENTQEMTQDLKETLNDSEYIRKEGAMICGIYDNESW